MVVMIMADEDDVDPRQIIKPDAGIPSPPWTDSGQRTRPLGPDWIRQDVEAVLLQQDGRMIDERDSELISYHVGRRNRLRDIRHEARRWFNTAGQLPAQQVQVTARRSAIRIEIAFPVEVIRNGKVCRRHAA